VNQTSRTIYSLSSAHLVNEFSSSSVHLFHEQSPTSLPVYNLDIYLSEHRHFSITLRLRHTGRLCFAARTFHRRAVSPPRCHAIVTGGGETK
jgi:hypothetical protein